MKTRNLLAFAAIAIIFWSCSGQSKTCPTYASAQSQAVKTSALN
jgi:hypothetical protein